MEIIDYTRESLMELFTDALPAINEQFLLIKKLDDLFPIFNDSQEKRKKTEKNTPIIIALTILFLSPALIFFLYCIFNKEYSESTKASLMTATITYIFLISFMPLIFFISKAVQNRGTGKLQEKINYVFFQIQSLHEKNPALDIIPLKYQTPLALEEMTEYLANYRATNWTDAVNILEETVHRNNMLYYQNKQLSTLNQQLGVINNIKKNTDTSGLDIFTALTSLASSLM